MQRYLRQLEMGWHVIALTLLSGAFVPLWRLQTAGSASQGDTVQQAVLLLSYGGLILLPWHWPQIQKSFIKGWLLWLVIGIAVISVLWSQDPALTLRRSFALLLATLYGLLLAVRYPFAAILRLIGVTMAIIVGTSLLSIAFGADWAVMGHPHPGAWQGVMFHKNALGRIAVLALIVFGVLAQQTRWPWQIGWRVLAISALALIVGARSATALVVTVALITIWMVAYGVRSLAKDERRQGVALASSIAIPVGMLVVFYWPEIADLLGRDPELTGRLPLWSSLLAIGWSQPLLGYGYGAFWLDTSRMMALDVALMRMRFWWAEHAHNGYLDVWLEIGIIGLIPVVFLVASVWRDGFHKVLQGAFQPKPLFIFLFTSFLVIYNLSEAVLIEANLAKALFWIIFSWVYFAERLTSEPTRTSLG